MHVAADSDAYRHNDRVHNAATAVTMGVTSLDTNRTEGPIVNAILDFSKTTHLSSKRIRRVWIHAGFEKIINYRRLAHLQRSQNQNR